MLYSAQLTATPPVAVAPLPLRRTGKPKSLTSPEWALYESDASTRDALLLAVVESIIALRFNGIPSAAQAWRRVRAGGPPFSDKEKERHTVGVRPSFGTPKKPSTSVHVEAAVAEHMWYLVMTQDPSTASVFVEPPKHYVTAPGGDGLSFHPHPSGHSFRLWEVKKHSAKDGLGRTLADASKQLSADALRHLAQYAAIGARAGKGLDATYSTLVESWQDGSAHAGAGITVASHTAPKRAPFKPMTKYFTHLVGPHALLGHVLLVSDFPTFCENVRKELWIGL